MGSETEVIPGVKHYGLKARVEAIQWDGTPKRLQSFRAWLKTFHCEFALKFVNNVLTIDVLDGDGSKLLLQKGDYLMYDDRDEWLSVAKQANFESKYQELPA